MGKRLVLYVPDNRQAQVDEWRDKLNYSRLFFEAFDREVALKTEVSKMKDSGMELVLERLKREQTLMYEEINELGRSDGMTWAKDLASPRHLRLVASPNKQEVVGLVGDNGNSLMEWLTDKYPAILEVDPYADDPEYGLMTDVEKQRWFYGFIQGAQDIWNQIKDDLDS